MMYVEEALNVLFSNKIRSLLTVLGLIIGVGAVIAIQVLGKSMAGAVGGALGDLADNSFIVFPNAVQGNFIRAQIKLTDLAQIRNDVPQIVDALPIGGRNLLIQQGHHTGRYAVSPDGSIPFNNSPVHFGRRFIDEDVAGAANVCVISDAAYTRLFPDGGDPTGKSIYAGVHRYVIVGVLAPPRRGFINAQFGGDVSIPYTTFLHQYIRGSALFAARFIVRDAAQITVAEVAVVQELHHLHGDVKNIQYQTFDKSQLTQGINGIFGALTLIVALIGAVSLLVAGIGIMNIMLVSVTERTREIGVRKAIGARRGQILIQFFIEALLLCGIGCGIGLGIGLAIGAAVNQFAIIKLTGYVAPLPWVQAALIALTFTAVVTLAFGTYPAYRAARLDPIEALRYE